DEFAVILPESTLEDAKQLYQRLQAHAGSTPVPQAGPLSFSGGVAELRQQDDPNAFFQRADEALYKAKEAGKGHAVPATNEGNDGRAPPAPPARPQTRASCRRARTAPAGPGRSGRACSSTSCRRSGSATGSVRRR